MGVPVFYDDGLRHVFAHTCGVGRWKKIVVGAAWAKILPRFQAAILAHEVGHVRLKHHEARFLRFWMLLWPPSASKFYREQEHEADLFAAKMGYRQALIELYQKMDGFLDLYPDPENEEHRIIRRVQRFYNPELKERIARLQKGD